MSKSAILSSLAQAAGPASELPDLAEFAPLEYDDPLVQFETTLTAVGGRAIRVDHRAQLAETLRSLPVVREADRRFSTLPGELGGDVDLESLGSPKELSGLPLAIVEGVLAVAENGAVWVNDRRIAERAVLFLAEHLVIVVATCDLVHNMHEAYERLASSQAFSPDEPRYGLFISGPSKTADIEQSLVIGAQGPRSLHVLLVGEDSSATRPPTSDS